MKLLRIAAFGLLCFGLWSCTQEQYDNASKKVETLQKGVDGAAAVGLGGPWAVGGSLALNLLQCWLTRKAKSGEGKAKADAKLKTSAFGVASRALDAAAGSTAGKHILEEIPGAPGITTAVMKTLHDLARSKEI
jgi:hypothetical protein